MGEIRAPEERSVADFATLYRSERSRREQLEREVAELRQAREQLIAYADDLHVTYAALQRRLQQLTVLNEIVSSLGSTLLLEEVAATTLDGLPRLVACRGVMIRLLDHGVTRLLASRGAPEALALLEPAICRDGPGGVARYRQARIEAGDDPHAASVGGGDAGPLPVVLPLTVREQIVGALGLLSAAPGSRGDEDATLLDLLANQVAIAADKALLYEETQRLAITDDLTGLHNHRYFGEVLAQEIQKARRLDYSVGLLIVDLDRFKAVNDLWGHPRGDEVLREVAGLIQSAVRCTDVVARYGGEEFVVILPGCRPESLPHVAEKLRAAIAEAKLGRDPDNLPSGLTASIGGACYPPDASDSATLLKRADAALYEAKRTGRNRVYVTQTA